MAGKKLRTVFVVLAVVLAGAMIVPQIALIVWEIVISDPAVKTTTTKYYQNKEGLLVADIRFPANFMTLPLVRLRDWGLSGKTFVWKGDHWQKEQLFSKYGWGAEWGGRAVVKVPETKWRMEIWTAPKREIQIGRFCFAFPVRTNLSYSAEFPGRTNVVVEGGH